MYPPGSPPVLAYTTPDMIGAELKSGAPLTFVNPVEPQLSLSTLNVETSPADALALNTVIAIRVRLRNGFFRNCGTVIVRGVVISFSSGRGAIGSKHSWHCLVPL